MKTPVLGILVSIALTLGTIGDGVFAQGDTPVGLWETIDDESNEPESYVRIWVDNGELFGKVVKLILEIRIQLVLALCFDLREIHSR